MTTEEFKDKLVEQCAPLEIACAHISAAAETECPCICWSEIPPVYAFGDNSPIRQLRVQVDFFTKVEYDLTPWLIEDALNQMGVTVGMPELYNDWDQDREEYRTTWTCMWMGG